VQNTVRAEGDIDGREMNVLAFVFRGCCGLQGIDLLQYERETGEEIHERTFMNISSYDCLKSDQKYAGRGGDHSHTCFFVCSSNLEPSYRSLRARFSIFALSFASCFSSFLTSTLDALPTQHVKKQGYR
jgi:hypothetical protein